MLLGRVVGPGEPEFLPEDTAAVIALGEEERDACPACGMPKVWCRDVEHQFSFETDESVCWPTHKLASRRGTQEFKDYDDATRAALQLSARFRKDHRPEVTAGLGLEVTDEG